MHFWLLGKAFPIGKWLATWPRVKGEKKRPSDKNINTFLVRQQKVGLCGKMLKFSELIKKKKKIVYLQNYVKENN